MNKKIKYYYSSSGEVPKCPVESTRSTPDSEEPKVKGLQLRKSGNDEASREPVGNLSTLPPITIRIPTFRSRQRSMNYRNTVCYGELNSLRSSHGTLHSSLPNDTCYPSLKHPDPTVEKSPSLLPLSPSEKERSLNSSNPFSDISSSMRSLSYHRNSARSLRVDSMDGDQPPSCNVSTAKSKGNGLFHSSNSDSSTAEYDPASHEYVPFLDNGAGAPSYLTDQDFLSILTIAYAKILPFCVCWNVAYEELCTTEQRTRCVKYSFPILFRTHQNP